MLTGRGWWFLSAVATITFLGVVWLAWASATVPILGLSLLLWFLVEWFLFAVRLRRSTGCLKIQRALIQGGREVPAVWAGSRLTVRLRVTLEADTRLPFAVVEDRPPAEFVPAKRAQAEFDLRAWKTVEFEYDLETDTPGVLRFEGVHLRVADPAGFFYRRVFVRQPVEYLVLPPLTDDEGHQRGTKRFNTLPPPGVHRLRRPGGGSELLDLREYRPGDPPKMIAWKPSARRDKLITKELESDVPVRCVVFLDASNSARIGPSGHNALTRSATIASAVSQAATANRDIVGLTIFDETDADTTQPARTRTHSIQLMRKLAEAAAKLPDPKHTDADLLSRYALPVAKELYPDLMGRDLNSRPFGLYWFPISDTRWMWILPIPFLLSGLLATQSFWINTAASVAERLKPRTGNVWFDLIVFLSLLLLVMFLPTVLVVVLWFFHGVRGFFSPHAPRTTRRKQLGAVFAALDGTGPAAIERAISDDVFFAERATRFHVEHRVPLPLVLHDRQGQYRFRSEGRAVVLSNAILRAVGRARDNELYVILADLTELGDDVQPVLNAARVARARHHQVLVIVPWPADMPPPADPSAEAEPRERKPFRIGHLVKAALVSRYHRDYAALRTAFVKAGATVVRVEDGDPVALVLERLDRVRGVRVRR